MDRGATEGHMDSMTLADSFGVCTPQGIEMVVSKLKERFQQPIEIHCHEDFGLGVANTIAAVTAGAKHVQGTLNGYGERCGNANLLSIIANLKIKMGINCVSDEQLVRITDASRYVSEIVNIPPNNQQPYVKEKRNDYSI